MDTPFYACATSVDPDQPAHPSVPSGRIIVRNNVTNQKVNSLDPDQEPVVRNLICGIN
jgi:hypothetical protein